MLSGTNRDILRQNLTGTNRDILRQNPVISQELIIPPAGTRPVLPVFLYKQRHLVTESGNKSAVDYSTSWQSPVLPAFKYKQRHLAAESDRYKQRHLAAESGNR